MESGERRTNETEDKRKTERGGQERKVGMVTEERRPDRKADKGKG